MGTEPILAMLRVMQLALNVGKHQRKTSQTQTLGVNGPLDFMVPLCPIAEAVGTLHTFHINPSLFIHVK